MGHENRCSFCGKKQTDQIRLIAGPGVFICSQCVALCNEILAHEQTHQLTTGETAEKPSGPESPPTVRAVTVETTSTRSTS